MLEDAIGGIRDEAVALSEQGIWIALTGLILLLTDKVMKSLKANWALVARFSDWLFNRGLRSGLPVSHVVFSAIFMILIIIAAVLHYSLHGCTSSSPLFQTHMNYLGTLGMTKTDKGAQFTFLSESEWGGGGEPNDVTIPYPGTLLDHVPGYAKSELGFTIMSLIRAF